MFVERRLSAIFFRIIFMSESVGNMCLSMLSAFLFRIIYLKTVVYRLTRHTGPDN